MEKNWGVPLIQHYFRKERILPSYPLPLMRADLRHFLALNANDEVPSRSEPDHAQKRGAWRHHFAASFLHHGSGLGGGGGKIRKLMKQKKEPVVSFNNYML